MSIEDRINELTSDEVFVSGMFEAKTPSELMTLFAEYKIELDNITPEEVFANIQKTKNGELQEDELENVSGGAIPLGLVVFCASSPLGAMVLTGAAAVALVGCAYYFYKKKK